MGGLHLGNAGHGLLGVGFWLAGRGCVEEVMELRHQVVFRKLVHASDDALGDEAGLFLGRLGLVLLEGKITIPTLQ